MSLLKSIFFGSPGTYNICGTPIEFKKDPYIYHESTISSQIFNCVNQRYFRVFVGVIANALMSKALIGKATSNICTIDTGHAYIMFPSEFNKKAEWKKTVVYCSGVMSVINLSIIEIIATKVLSNYAPPRLTMLVASGVALSILDGLFYKPPMPVNYNSNINIAVRDNTQMILTTILLTAQIALGLSIISKIN